MSNRSNIIGFAVHLLTASGAVCGLLALFYATRQDWSSTFMWLGVALIIDGADGPLARRWGNTSNTARFSGERLDLVVDYLNYCTVPAFIIVQSQLLSPSLALLGGSIVLMSSLFHFADTRSKTADGFFVGFPAIWNIICLYLFAFDLRDFAALSAIVILACLTFIPIHWLHPVRVRGLRPLTLLVTSVWAAATIATVINGFPAGIVERTILAITGAYVVGLGVLHSFWPGAFGNAEK